MIFYYTRRGFPYPHTILCPSSRSIHYSVHKTNMAGRICSRSVGRHYSVTLILNGSRCIQRRDTWYIQPCPASSAVWRMRSVKTLKLHRTRSIQINPQPRDASMRAAARILMKCRVHRNHDTKAGQSVVDMSTHVALVASLSSHVIISNM